MNSNFMLAAITEAKAAAKRGEIPVGAVIVKDGNIIAKGSNRREEKHSVISHAEIEAIEEACGVLGDWRLDGCELYVTLEPCPMCTGAIINSRISTVVFGAYDLRAGSMDSVINLCDYPYESKPEIYGGIYEDECKKLLSDFFKAVRKDEEKD
ncbi:MAG: nucleoside deaminase [Clostridia bacterium]|nr:nucleoside deaminase [Clostridia bacterium]